MVNRFGVWRVTRFYIPLLLQAFSQSLTYPLVAGIVTHGEYGVNALTAFTQGQAIMFMVGALGGGLVTTGLVFAKSWYGYLSFKRLNALMMAALLVLQCVPAISPLDKIVFGGLFNLPPELAEIARWTLVAGAVMNAGFFLRNVPMVVLFNNLESGKANNATIARILVTLACSVLFPKCGMVGPWWGLFALTFGVWVELAITWWYARPYVRELRKVRPCGADERPSHGEIVSLTLEQFRFTLPLSLGGFLLSASPLLSAAFVGRSANAVDMLAIHYVTLGVANPVAFGALRMQAVSIQFPPERDGDRRLLVYAIVAGLALGVVPFVFSLPAIGNWYFGVYQNMPSHLIGITRMVTLAYSAICVIHAVRARIEGIAAYRKCPKAVMAGQIAYTMTMLISLSVMLPLKCPGWLMSVTAIFLSPMMTTIAVYGWLAKNGILREKP